MKKNFTLFLALTLCCSAYAEKLTILSAGEGTPGRDVPALLGLGISPDGKYVCGAIEMGVGVFVADAETGDVKWELAGDEGGELRHIDNNGLAIGIMDGGITYSFDTSKVTDLPAPAGYKYILGESINNDGSIMVGSLIGTVTRGVYTSDAKTWHMLPTPTEEDLAGLPKIQNGTAAKCISADGKVILGYIGSFSLPVVWIMNDKGEYEIDVFPKRLLLQEDSNILSISAMYMNLSNNGRYVCAVGLAYSEELDDTFNVPVVFDTKTKEFKIYDKVQDIDEGAQGLYPTAICNNGSFIGTIGQPYYYSEGSYIIHAGSDTAIPYCEAFPAFDEIFGESDSLGYNMPTAMSADGRYILGYTYYCKDYYDQSADAYWSTYIIDTELAGIEDIDSDSNENSIRTSIHSLDGRVLSHLEKGVNIVRKEDGTVSKILVK